MKEIKKGIHFKSNHDKPENQNQSFDREELEDRLFKEKITNFEENCIIPDCNMHLTKEKIKS